MTWRQLTKQKWLKKVYYMSFHRSPRICRSAEPSFSFMSNTKEGTGYWLTKAATLQFQIFPFTQK